MTVVVIKYKGEVVATAQTDHMISVEDIFRLSGIKLEMLGYDSIDFEVLVCSDLIKFELKNPK